MNIPQTTGKTLSACAIVDIIDGEIKCCEGTEKLRRLWQLVGMWQLDKLMVEGVDGDLDKLGVCYSHFMFDQNKLHSEGTKRLKSTLESLIHSRRCRFCGTTTFRPWRRCGRSSRIAVGRANVISKSRSIHR